MIQNLKSNILMINCQIFLFNNFRLLLTSVLNTVHNVHLYLSNPIYTAKRMFLIEVDRSSTCPLRVTNLRPQGLRKKDTDVLLMTVTPFFILP